jgi:hypothetical protein
LEVGQAEAAVALEDGEARGPEAATGQHPVVGGKRAQRRPAVGLRATPVVGGDARPQLLACVVELVEQLDAPFVEPSQLAVTGGQLVQQRVTLDLEAQALGRTELRRHPVGEQAAGTGLATNGAAHRTSST